MAIGAKRMLIAFGRWVIKAIGVIAGLLFVFANPLRSDAELGLFVLSIVLALVCFFLWSMLDNYDDLDDSAESAK